MEPDWDKNGGGGGRNHHQKILLHSFTRAILMYPSLLKGGCPVPPLTMTITLMIVT